jgi:ribosomal protein S18 acetylase RimI-like enzyme
MEMVVIKARPEDISDITRIHMLSFQNYFLSSFGKEFLNIYYKSYKCNSGNILLVAKFQGQTIGFVAGTTNPELLYQELFRRNFFSVVKIVCKRFLISRQFRKGVFRRRSFILKAVNAKFRRSDLRNKSNVSIEHKEGKLLSIAVIEDFRGEGVALNLIREFEREMEEKGVVVCTLTVKPENFRGIGFYKKAEWQIVHETKESIKFLKIVKNYRV